MRAVALCALLLGGCLDFDSLPSRFQGDLATDDQGDAADLSIPDDALDMAVDGS
jgi:hypothetical protein